MKIPNITVEEVISLDGDSLNNDWIEIYKEENDSNILLWEGSRLDYFATTDSKGNTIKRKTQKYDTVKIKNASFITYEKDDKLVMLLSIYI